MRPEKKPLNETCAEAGVDRRLFLEFVQQDWIHAHPEDELWSEEDALRARLIFELQRDFGVNDEAIPIILHLLDQIYSIRESFERR